MEENDAVGVIVASSSLSDTVSFCLRIRLILISLVNSASPSPAYGHDMVGHTSQHGLGVLHLSSALIPQPSSAKCEA